MMEMLCEKFSKDVVRKHLQPPATWAPFPRACERPAWEALLAVDLNRQRAASLIGAAEALVNQPWPDLPAVRYADYARDGNRSRFQTPYFARRQNLAVLVMAECFEHRGRFTDEILNGLYHILEETTWCLPAHALRHPGDLFPREDLETVDLFACETAAVLADTLYLLEGEISSLTTTLPRRLRMAIEARVIRPAEQDPLRHWWSDGRNNWTPWCCSNILGAALVVLDDQDRLASLIADTLNPSIDRFISKYPDDGCCDEGPVYWTVSPGALLVYLEHLHGRTNGAVSIYDEPKLRRMGEYAANAHLAGHWALNFADANAKMTVHRGVTYRFGDRIGSEPMKALVRHGMRNWEPAGTVTPLLQPHCNGGDLQVMLREIFWIPADEPAGLMTKSRTVWYPQTEVLVARESEEAGRGFILGAKGGHNAEQHNHNDIGQFVLLRNGKPFLVDAGVDIYTRLTFSDQRYTLWYMRSSGHAVPCVNGVEQAAGASFRATGVSFTDRPGERVLSLELRSAYPGDAPFTSARRTFRCTEGCVELTDAIVAAGKILFEVPLLTPATVTADGPHAVILDNGGERVRLSWSAGAAAAALRTETIPLEGNLSATWGPTLTRLTLTWELPAGGGNCGMVCVAV
jgi:hypothetical protein